MISKAIKTVASVLHGQPVSRMCNKAQVMLFRSSTSPFCRNGIKLLSEWLLMTHPRNIRDVFLIDRTSPLPYAYRPSRTSIPLLRRLCAANKNIVYRNMYCENVSRTNSNKLEPQRTQLNDVTHCTHDQETNTNSLADLGELLLIRYIVKHNQSVSRSDGRSR